MKYHDIKWLAYYKVPMKLWSADVLYDNSSKLIYTGHMGGHHEYEIKIEFIKGCPPSQRTEVSLAELLQYSDYFKEVSVIRSERVITNNLSSKFCGHTVILHEYLPDVIAI